MKNYNQIIRFTDFGMQYVGINLRKKNNKIETVIS